MKDKIKTVSKEEINLMDKGYNPERVRSDEPATWFNGYEDFNITHSDCDDEHEVKQLSTPYSNKNLLGDS